jgi:hypothetical protein
MNAHSLRPMLRRRNFLPLTVLFLSSLVVVCGLVAGAARSSAEGAGGVRSGAQIPPGLSNPNGEDAKKDFDDNDLKVKEQKPRGKWGTALETDMNQFNDVSAPVAIGAVQSLSGGGKYAGVVKIKRLEIKNKSSKIVNSVQLRWEIVSLDDRAKVLSEDATPFINIWVEANSSLIVEIPTLYPALMLKPLAKGGELNGRFSITLGVQEARFADGSFWRRQERIA